MGKFKVRHLREKPSGLYFEPSSLLKAAGFSAEALGNDLVTAIARCKERGAKRAIPLKVAGAYHSAVMRPAQEKMREELSRVKISKPRIPVYANVSATPTTDPEEIRTALATQICSPVRWEESIRAIGARSYTEFGPGRVLAGLVRKIDPAAEVTSIEGI